jgi:hypothetical protein
MKVHKLAKFAGVAIALGIYFLPSGTTSEKSFVVFAQAADSPCKPPAQITGSVEETAWRIFVAATCPTANPKKYPYVTWEKWIEQEQQYPSAPGAAPKVSELMTVEQRFHRSRLALARTAATALPQGANEGCGPGQGDPSVTICEEVRLNSGPSGTSAYVTQTAPGKTLISRTQQATFAASSPSSKPAINLPPAAVEIKADWIQLRLPLALR